MANFRSESPARVAPRLTPKKAARAWTCGLSLIHFDNYIVELLKILVETRHWNTLGSGCSCEDAIDDVELSTAVAGEGIDVDGSIGQLNTRTAYEALERLRDFGAGLLVKRFQNKYAFREDDREDQQRDIAAIAGGKQFAGLPGMAFVVLHKMADDKVGIDKAALSHFGRCRRRSAVAAFRIWAKVRSLPLLLDRIPLRAMAPGCLRKVTWSPSISYWSRSPGWMRRAWRTAPGMVVWPFLVTVECIVNLPYFLVLPYF